MAKCETKGCLYYDTTMTDNCSRNEPPDVENCRHRNARLIAAGPDLLEACKAVLEQLGDDPCWFDHHGYCQAHSLAEKDDCWATKVRAAISKATE